MARGFAGLNAEQRKRMAQRGAQRLHKLGKAHRFTSDEAKAAQAVQGKAGSQPKEDSDGKTI